MHLRHVPDRELTLSPAEFVPSEGSPVSLEDQRAEWVRQRAREAGFRFTHDETTGWQLAEPAEIVEHVDGFVTLRQWITGPPLRLIPMLNSRPPERAASTDEPALASTDLEPGPAWLHLESGARVLLRDAIPARTPSARRAPNGEPAFVVQGEPEIERDGDEWRLVVRISPFTSPGPAGI